MLFPVRVVVDLAPSLDLPEGECFFERLVVFLLQHEEAAIAVVIELGHHRPIGIESVEHEGVNEPSVGSVQGIDQPPGGGQFAFMADVFAVDIAARFLIEHRFDPQHDIDDRPEQHGHDIAVVILIHFFEVTRVALHFDLADQAVWAMPIIGGKRFPAVHGHAAQGAVATIAKGLVPLGLVDHVLHRFVEALQMQLVQNIGHHIGAEGLHVRCGMTANELLEVFLLQIPFQRIDAGDAQHRGVKQAVDNIESRNFRSSPGID